MALDFKGIMQGPLALIAAAQDLTVAWADLGDEQYVQGARRIALWIDLDINDSANARFRILARHAEGGDDFILPIRTTGAAIVRIEDEFIEWNVDANHQTPYVWYPDGLVPYVQFQVQVGVLGAPAGQILEALVTTAH